MSEESREGAEVTLIVTARERYSFTEGSLQSLLDNTDVPFKMVYVDVNSPRHVADFLSAAAKRVNFTLVRVNTYISPNAARNVGLRYADTKYVVFLDNDVEYAPGWLPPLVQCAEQEDAALVGPLYLHGPLDEKTVHMAGGDMKFTGDWGRRQFTQTQRYFTKHLDEVPRDELTRQRCDIIEFHCALARRDIFERVGAMDEGLLTTREHLDLCQRVLEAGGTIWFEPESVITYRLPPPFDTSDLPYFLLRWSDEWTRQTLQHFAYKHGITPAYTERVAKTRKRRQHLVFSSFEPRLRSMVGERATGAAKALFSAVEPVANRVIVEVLTTRGDKAEPAVVHRTSALVDSAAGSRET